jgi:hypothetical protein
VCVPVRERGRGRHTIGLYGRRRRAGRPGAARRRSGRRTTGGGTDDRRGAAGPAAVLPARAAARQAHGRQGEARDQGTPHHRCFSLCSEGRGNRSAPPAPEYKTRGHRPEHQMPQWTTAHTRDHIEENNCDVRSCPSLAPKIEMISRDPLQRYETCRGHSIKFVVLRPFSRGNAPTCAAWVNLYRGEGGAIRAPFAGAAA